ncbi:MAG: DEAD/DEAH box helicase [Prevotella sp.]|nr:DEAD/DEAH box helicase [Prevotella sp.]
MLFSDLGLSEEILKAVEKLGYEEATEIQAKTIPLLMEGRDVIGRSHTGTGKTAAFGIPAVSSIQKSDGNTVRILILCPTRELAMQACGELDKFSDFMPWVRTCAVYGGADIERQITRLRRGANIVVGTPGRVMDHINRRTLKLDGVRTVILDEADEMLNMGFREDIETILGFVPEERQTVLFSATMPEAIMAITEKYQRDPVAVGVEEKSRTVDSVEQFYFDVPMGRKTDALQMLLLAYEPKLSMIFCNTKKMVDELSEQLVSKGFRAAGLHGDMKQASRTQTLNAFKSGRLNILIATDVAARGIDVDDVDAVFNYDIPQDCEYYIHRIGRTGRAGKSGAAYTIASGRRQVSELMDVARCTKARIERRELPSRDEVLAAKANAVAEAVKSCVMSGKYEKYAEQVAALGEEGFSAEQLAAALLGMKISAETKNVPEFIKPVFRPERGEKGSGRPNSVKVEISVGRANRIAPNFVLGALVDATGMPGRNFGKIDIYDRFTTVEVPEADKEHVIDSMTGTKINGQKIRIKLYEGRDKGGRDVRDGRDRRGGKRDLKRQRYGNHNAAASAGRRNSKRYQ